MEVQQQQQQHPVVRRGSMRSAIVHTYECLLDKNPIRAKRHSTSRKARQMARKCRGSLKSKTVRESSRRRALLMVR